MQELSEVHCHLALSISSGRPAMAAGRPSINSRWPAVLWAASGQLSVDGCGPAANHPLAAVGWPSIGDCWPAVRWQLSVTNLSWKTVCCSSATGLYLCVMVGCSSGKGQRVSGDRWPHLITQGFAVMGSDHSMVSDNGWRHVIMLGFLATDCGMRSRMGTSLEIDTCQHLLPFAVKHQSPPRPDTGSNEEWRNGNIRNPIDSCMQWYILVHTCAGSVMFI